MASPAIVVEDFVEAALNFASRNAVEAYRTKGHFGAINIRELPRETRRVRIWNARSIQSSLSLDANGFQCVRATRPMLDFYDEALVRRIYYPEIEQQVKTIIGAAKATALGHRVRHADQRSAFDSATLPAVRRIHNDFTAEGAPSQLSTLFRLRPTAEEELDAVLHGRRIAVVNVWRSIAGPVFDTPLGLLDARTVSSSDFVVTERRLSEDGFQTYGLLYRDAQRWFYFSNLQEDEFLLFKVYDSEIDGRARFTFHTAFDVPQNSQNPPQRKSIEVSVFALF